MKLTKCDRHPDRDAVATFTIRELPAGARPILLGLDPVVRVIDLCQDCAELVRPIATASNRSDRTKS